MLSQSPGNTWHVSGLPCKNVPVLTEELDERFFLFWVECCGDAGRSCFGVGRVNVNRLRLTGRLECRLCGGLLGSQQVTRICVLLVFFELDRCHLGIGNLGALLKALLCLFPITGDSDHTFGTGHLQFEVHVTWSSHEPCIGWSPQNGMICTLKIHDLKRQLFFAKMFRITK